MKYIDVYVQIRDNESGNIIFNDYAKYSKNEFIKRGLVSDNVSLVSYDNKYFFKVNSDKFTVEEGNASKDSIIKFDPINIPKHWIVRSFREYYKTTNNEYIDVYREFGIDELDPDVEPLVTALNNIGYTTTGSCSGHNEDQLYVDISFRNIYEIKLLLKLLKNKHISNKFYLASENRLFNDMNTSALSLRLFSKNIGEQAYKDTLVFTDILNMSSIDLRDSNE